MKRVNDSPAPRKLDAPSETSEGATAQFLSHQSRAKRRVAFSLVSSETTPPRPLLTSLWPSPRSA